MIIILLIIFMVLQCGGIPSDPNKIEALWLCFGIAGLICAITGTDGENGGGCLTGSISLLVILTAY